MIAPRRRLAKELDELRGEVAFLRSAVGASRDDRPFADHPHVTLGEGADIAPGVTIWASSDRPVSIGAGTRIYRGAEMIGPIRIGERSMINRDGYIRAEVTIGDHVAVGPFSRFVSDTHDLGPSSHRAGRFHSQPIVVGDGVWIGAGVTILGGVTIHPGAVVAAGSVVTRDVPPDALVAGVPATTRRTLE